MSPRRSRARSRSPFPRSIRTSSHAASSCSTPSRRDWSIGSSRSSAAALVTESFSRARDIALAVRNAGGRALFVGGWVRGRLMDRDSKDIDVEVFGVPADRLKALLESLGRVETVGESFQVFKAGEVDVSLPRRESKSGRGHRGFDVTGDPSMTTLDAAR